MSGALPRLVIEPTDDGLVVRVGDRFADLGRDEVLWTVAQYLHGQLTPYLLTADQHAAQLAKYGQRDDAAATLLGQIAGASVAVDRAKGGAS